MEENLRKIWKIIVFSIFVYIVLGMYSDFSKLTKAFQLFNWRFFALIILLTLVNYSLRFLKWHYLLVQLEKVDIKTSLWAFLSGMIMIVTPGKLGEVWKAWLLKDAKGIRVSKTIPSVIVDRITDVLGLTLLASIGTLTFGLGKYFVILIFGGFVLFLTLLRFDYAFDFIIKVSEKKFSLSVGDIYTGLRDLLKVRNVVSMTFLASFSWFFECLGLFYAVRGFNHGISIVKAIFAFSFSSVAGSLSMIPGGIGVAEASMSSLLSYFGLPLEVAVASTLIIRFGTIWFGVLLGFIVYWLSKFRTSRLKITGVKK